ncbi:hypothetical protein JCM11641_007834 [Rhodosporidiobolus odoratus]
MPRPRLPLRTWPTRAYSTQPNGLPAPLQRELFRHVAQPVAVLTAHIPSPSITPRTPQEAGQTLTEAPKHNHGATLSSLTSISLSPPLVSFSLRLPSRLASHLSQSSNPPSFRLHLLSSSQEAVARAFARQAPLPAPPAPSPPPLPSSSSFPPSGLNPWERPLEPALFEQLEKDGLGWLDCRVVRRIPLADLGKEKSGAGPTGGLLVEEQPRSELFIAEVEKVQVSRAGRDAGLEGEEEGEGCLLWWNQRYLAAPERGEGAGRDGKEL